MNGIVIEMVREDPGKRARLKKCGLVSFARRKCYIPGVGGGGGWGLEDRFGPVHEGSF